MKRLTVLLIVIAVLMLFLPSCQRNSDESETTVEPDPFYPIDIYMPIETYSVTMSSVPGLPVEVYSDYEFTITCEGAGSLIELTADGKIIYLETPIEDAPDMTYYWVPEPSLVSGADSPEPIQVSTITLYNPTQVIKIGVFVSENVYTAEILDEPEI